MAYIRKKHIAGINPDAAYIEAFAAHAAGDRRAAFAAFLHAALNRPRAARMLLGLRVPRAISESEADRWADALEGLPACPAGTGI